MLCDSLGGKPERTQQEACPSVGKNTKVVLVSCYAWNCVSTSVCSGVGISKGSWCHLLR